MKDRRILEAVLLERGRQDRNMVMLEFNIHPDMVVMSYIYDDHDDGSDVHKRRHDRDPEIIDRNTFEAVKAKFNEHGIPYRERRDAFI
ncbi:hypothetical protein ACFOLA_10140 [Salinicoccus hispanicus]|uniref:Uncharacterized protein n=1 Tax=Salinicoccus hispanicus TaxID=157225 RepID=A0A6N8U230_9STAP|nr:hypothetical protein [Salinicoccus hispanicus]MXQ49739.1 hypothetical protein [Salinicoccus hispanicus]